MVVAAAAAASALREGFTQWARTAAAAVHPEATDLS
jgi:hypothetical protein